MGIVTHGDHCHGHIQKYIGSAYDVVKAVGDNLDKIENVHAALGTIENLLATVLGTNVYFGGQHDFAANATPTPVKVQKDENTEQTQPTMWRTTSAFVLDSVQMLTGDWIFYDTATQTYVPLTRKVTIEGGSGGGEHDHIVEWGDIANVPATFPPATHSHTVNWSDVQSKPEEYKPQSHTHSSLYEYGDVAADGAKLTIANGVCELSVQLKVSQRVDLVSGLDVVGTIKHKQTEGDVEKSLVDFDSAGNYSSDVFMIKGESGSGFSGDYNDLTNKPLRLDIVKVDHEGTPETHKVQLKSPVIFNNAIEEKINSDGVGLGYGTEMTTLWGNRLEKSTAPKNYPIELQKIVATPSGCATALSGGAASLYGAGDGVYDAVDWRTDDEHLFLASDDDIKFYVGCQTTQDTINPLNIAKNGHISFTQGMVGNEYRLAYVDGQNTQQNKKLVAWDSLSNTFVSDVFETKLSSNQTYATQAWVVSQDYVTSLHSHSGYANVTYDNAARLGGYAHQDDFSYLRNYPLWDTTLSAVPNVNVVVNGIEQTATEKTCYATVEGVRVLAQQEIAAAGGVGGGGSGDTGSGDFQIVTKEFSKGTINGTYTFTHDGVEQLVSGYTDVIKNGTFLVQHTDWSLHGPNTIRLHDSKGNNLPTGLNDTLTIRAFSNQVNSHMDLQGIQAHLTMLSRSAVENELPIGTVIWLAAPLVESQFAAQMADGPDGGTWLKLDIGAVPAQKIFQAEYPELYAVLHQGDDNLDYVTVEIPHNSVPILTSETGLFDASLVGGNYDAYANNILQPKRGLETKSVMLEEDTTQAPFHRLISFAPYIKAKHSPNYQLLCDLAGISAVFPS